MWSSFRALWCMLAIMLSSLLTIYLAVWYDLHVPALLPLVLLFAALLWGPNKSKPLGSRLLTAHAALLYEFSPKLACLLRTFSVRTQRTGEKD